MKLFTESMFKPTSLHKMPCGMRWKHNREDGSSSFWIQVSEDIESPRWITIDEFFGKIIEKKIEDDRFMDKFLKLYNNPERHWWVRLYWNK